MAAKLEKFPVLLQPVVRMASQQPALLLLHFFSLFVVICSHQISTSQGDIAGIIKKTVYGREFSAFYGVPYAQAPVGDLRFKNGVPFGTWTGVKDASKVPPPCIQKNMYDNQLKFVVIGSEDCLYVNVFTPSTNEPKKFPVMVYFHGGGFQCGSSTYYGPEFLLDKDIVLVTVNYRLAFFGFASTGDEVLPGNLGLKDQVLALKWVQKYIHSYGGNPDSVTVLGQSAGGASSHYHMISPLSKGLLHRAIPMSGTSHCPWALAAPGVNEERTRKLGEKVGCPSEPSEALINCLREISAHKITDLVTDFNVFGIDPPVIFAPVVEPKGVRNAFLDFDPTYAETSIPFMTGFTSEDGAFRVALFNTSEEGMDGSLAILNQKYDTVAPVSITIYQDPNVDVKKIVRKVRNFYFGDKEINRETLPELIKAYTDAWFGQCSVSVLRNHKGISYFYLFAEQGRYSTTYKLSNSTEYFGASHADELMYLFPLTYHVTRDYNEHEIRLRDMIITLWTNFATYGEPTTDGLWKPVANDDINYLHIENGEAEMREQFFKERVDFWENLDWKEKYSHVKRDEL